MSPSSENAHLLHAAEAAEYSPQERATLLRLAHRSIEAALAEAQGRVSGPTGAAARLGIPSTTLDSKIRALGINKHRFKTP